MSVKPGTWPAINAGDLSGSRLKIISQNPETGEERVINEMELQKYVAARSEIMPILYVPTFSGNVNNKNRFVIDPNNDIWFIDIAGNGLKFAKADIHYYHTQLVSTDTWVIPHNLGRRVNVQAFDVDDYEIIGRVINDTLNDVIIQFTIPIVGTAILS
jgi:hypothetical protein